VAEEFSQRSRVPRVSLEDTNDASGSRVFIGAPDYRVFIWGIEVTSDVFSVSTSLTLDDSPSTALVNIVNDNEKWILPTGFAASNIDVIPDELSEATLESGTVGGHEDTLLGLSVGTNTKDPTFRYITPAKFARLKRENFKKKLGADIADTPSGSNSVAADLLKKAQSSNLFPFLPGRPLIQMFDPIRIFLKNPWKMGPPPEGTGVDFTSLPSFQQGLEPEEWYFAFTGYVAAATEDFDAQTNRSILRCSCEDIRRLLRYMRTSTNPNVFDMNVLEQDLAPVTAQGTTDFANKLKSTAADIVLVSGNAALSAGMTLVRRLESDPPGVLELLLLGDTDGITANEGGKSGDAAPFVSGVLGFRDGGKIVTTLTVDNNFEANLTRQALNDIYPILTPEEVSAFGIDWSLGAVADARPDLNGANRLWVILPDEAHFPAFRDPFDWGMRIDFFSEFRSRLDIINEFVKNMDCIWYATPKGDMVLEFPNYDCLPQLHDDPWRSILTLQNEFTRFSSTEDDRNIKTLTIAIGSGLESINTSKSEPFLAFYAHRNPELIARYGVREQRQNRPFFYDPRVIPGALAALATMWQELANADAYRLEGLEMLPNFRAVPGRPYFFKFRNQIGFCTSVQHQVVWNQLAQTVYAFNYIRHFDAAKGEWQKISGNYGWQWKPSESSPTAAIVDNTSKGPDFIRGARDGITLADPTANNMEQVHQEILQQETTSGQPLLNEEEHVRLDSITSRFSDTTNPPAVDERLTLLNEYNSIISKVGLTL
jgi:hypothetical protein